MPVTFNLLQCLCFYLKSDSVHLVASQPAGRLPCIWKCPSYEPAVQGWGSCHPHGRCCSNTIHCSCTPWLSHWTSLWSADSLEKREGKSLGLYTMPEVHTQDAVRKVIISPSETLFKFYLFILPMSHFSFPKNRGINISILGLVLNKHTLTWASMTKSSESSQMILSTSQETKAEDQLWDRGHLKAMAIWKPWPEA